MLSFLILFSNNVRQYIRLLLQIVNKVGAVPINPPLNPPHIKYIIRNIVYHQVSLFSELIPTVCFRKDLGGSNQFIDNKWIEQ